MKHPLCRNWAQAVKTPQNLERTLGRLKLGDRGPNRTIYTRKFDPWPKRTLYLLLSRQEADGTQSRIESASFRY
jgi:hypothetical protein